MVPVRLTLETLLSCIALPPRVLYAAHFHLKHMASCRRVIFHPFLASELAGLRVLLRFVILAHGNIPPPTSPPT